VTALILPRALRPGDTLGVFTPSAPSHVLHRVRYLRGLDRLRQLGFRVVEGALTARATEQGYRSGGPRERADELMELFDDPAIDGIVATIGGANSSSLLPYLDYGHIAAHPKVFCGYSDVTALHMALLTQARLGTFYGPAVVPSFGEPGGFAETEEAFLAAVSGELGPESEWLPPPEWSRKGPPWGTAKEPDPDARTWQPNAGWTVLRPGFARAPLLCANLSTLCALAGTRYFPRLDGRIVMLEEMAAPFSRVERNLRQLELMGALDGLAGLVLGKPEYPDAEGAPFELDELWAEIVGPHGDYPVVCNFDCGHTHPMLTLGQGAPVRLDARAALARLHLEAPMVA
jgi:muramoyltetrapeptide carboxypeptidase LdcA involved in peptidoglycan recycling